MGKHAFYSAAFMGHMSGQSMIDFCETDMQKSAVYPTSQFPPKSASMSKSCQKRRMMFK